MLCPHMTLHMSNTKQVSRSVPWYLRKKKRDRHHEEEPSCKPSLEVMPDAPRSPLTMCIPMFRSRQCFVCTWLCTGQVPNECLIVSISTSGRRKKIGTMRRNHHVKHHENQGPQAMLQVPLWKSAYQCFGIGNVLSIYGSAHVDLCQVPNVGLTVSLGTSGRRKWFCKSGSLIS